MMCFALADNPTIKTKTDCIIPYTVCMNYMPSMTLNKRTKDILSIDMDSENARPAVAAFQKMQGLWSRKSTATQLRW